VRFYRRFGFRRVGTFHTEVENFDMMLDLSEVGSEKGSRTGRSDTSEEARRVLIEGYRRMGPAEKLRQVDEMTRTVLDLLERACTETGVSLL
jgi:adenylosuccinate synthase